MKLHRELKCTRCGIDLHNDIDTFGDTGQEMCEDCWYEWYEEVNGVEYYGMAPHHHDLTITGSFIGSTILDPLPEPAADGRYWIESAKLWFQPDDEVDGAMGMWTAK